MQANAAFHSCQKQGRLPAIRLHRWVARIVVMDSRPFQDLPDIVGSFDDSRITIYANKVKQGAGACGGPRLTVMHHGKKPRH